jgi:hypothetical protein
VEEKRVKEREEKERWGQALCPCQSLASFDLRKLHTITSISTYGGCGDSSDRIKIIEA